MITKHGYYLNKNIQFELIHQLKDRETSFIPIGKAPVRWKKAHFIKMLFKHFDRYKFLRQKMNIYHSLAYYKYIPTMSYNTIIQKKQQKEWADDFHNHIYGYDLFIETDSSDNFEQAHKDAMEIKSIFDNFKLKYYLKNSGSKGFHYIIKYDDFKHLNLKVYDVNLNIKHFNKFLQQFPVSYDKLLKVTDLVSLFKVIAHRLKLLYSLDTIDTSVQDIKRIVKVAYSLDDKSGLIAYPLTDEQLLNFRKQDYTPEKVLSYNNYKRGLLFRNEDCDSKINLFLQELGIIT